MKILRLAITFVFLATAPSLSSADETFEVTADSTLSGNAGFIFNMIEADLFTYDFFLFEESGKVRVFAVNFPGSSTWDIYSNVQYICPTTSMSIGETWRFVDDDNERVATVVAQESVTTVAGTFSTYKVAIARASAPGTITDTFWFSAGVGVIRSEAYSNGVLDQVLELYSYTVSGSGFLPLIVGNVWNYSDPVPVKATSWGAVKSKYD